MYVLPYGQMSLWGNESFASNANLNINFIFTDIECLGLNNVFSLNNYLNNKWKGITTQNKKAEISANLSAKPCLNQSRRFEESINVGLHQSQKIRANQRIGPHDKRILEIIFGSLLGDGHAEFRSIGNGTRITFYQEGTHVSYLLWLHGLISNLGYSSTKIPEIQTRLGSKGIVRKIIRFRTWTYRSFNWIHDEWYADGTKKIPKKIAKYLTPLCLAFWITNSWLRNSQGLTLKKRHSYEDCLLLITALYNNFNLESNIVSTDTPSEYVIIIKVEYLTKLEHITSSTIVSKFMKHKVVGSPQRAKRAIKRNYSTLAIPQSFFISEPMSQEPILPKSLYAKHAPNPWFITGFSDAEASFMVLMNKNSKVKLGFQIQVCFQIGLHKKDRVLLEMIQFYFKGVGIINKQGEDLVQYRVTSLKDLRIIVDHFEYYPLITQKKQIFIFENRLLN